MLCDEEYFSTTGKDPHNVGIRKYCSRSSHVFLSSIEPVKALRFVELIDNDHLSSILYHAMASIAEEC